MGFLSDDIRGPEPVEEPWPRRVLREGGFELPRVEGYAIGDSGPTALLERRSSLLQLAQFSAVDIEKELATEPQFPWQQRVRLAEYLGVPLFLVVQVKGQESFRILQLKSTKLTATVIADLSSYKQLAGWLAKYKSIRVTKEFIEPGRLSAMDIALRENGVPWPGDLDGFFFGKKSGKPILIELTRTRKKAVKDHNLNQFYSDDRNRWAVFDSIHKQLKSHSYIMTWKTEEPAVKLQGFEGVSDSGIIFGQTETISKDVLVDRFNQLVATM